MVSDFCFTFFHLLLLPSFLPSFYFQLHDKFWIKSHWNFNTRFNEMAELLTFEPNTFLNYHWYPLHFFCSSVSDIVRVSLWEYGTLFTQSLFNSKWRGFNSLTGLSQNSQKKKNAGASNLPLSQSCFFIGNWTANKEILGVSFQWKVLYS